MWFMAYVNINTRGHTGRHSFDTKASGKALNSSRFWNENQSDDLS